MSGAVGGFPMKAQIAPGQRRCAVRRLSAGAERVDPDHDQPAHLRQPSPVEEAIAFCDSLLNEPHCEIGRPGPRHWRIFQRMCVEAGVRGPLTADAWFAALAIEHGCTWMTFDRDYARFPGLDWREPAV